jgi:arsenate reductase
MAEAFLKASCPNDFDTESAGLDPGELNPLAVAVMSEIGIDISRNRTKSAFDLFKQGRTFSYVITVCDETSAERCPTFPGVASRLHWSFADPAAFEGSWEQRLALTRVVRDQIRDRVTEWCKETCGAGASSLTGR